MLKNNDFSFIATYFLQLAPSKTTERLFMFVESLLMSHNNKEGGSDWQLILSKFKSFFTCSYLEILSTIPDPLQKLNLSPPVKAHAFVTLGKSQ